MARLLRRAASAFLHPKYVITDLGGEFTGKAFRNAVSRIGARLRFASADSIRATARLERFWRTLKETGRLSRGARPCGPPSAGETGGVLPFRVALCDPKNARFPILVAA